MGPGIILRQVGDSDLPLLEKWLRKDRILKWYHDADEWLGEIRERNGAFRFLNHFMVMAEDMPIGFGQWYDCFDAREEWYEVVNRNEMFSIDYLVGEDDFLGRGYGKAIVRALVDAVKELQPAARIVVRPEPENLASTGALSANGFVYDQQKKYFVMQGITRLN